MPEIDLSGGDIGEFDAECHKPENTWKWLT